MKEQDLINSVGQVETKTYVLKDPEKILLDCGRTLPYIQVAYETYGKLNDEKSNAILIVHALSGDAHAAGYHSIDGAKSPAGGTT